MPKSVVLAGLLMLAAAYIFAIDSADSGPEGVFFALLLGGPLSLVVGFMALCRGVWAVRNNALRIGTLGFFAAGVIFASLAIYEGVWHWLHPANIHYTISCNGSETWQEIQFTHTENGKEIEGPFVAGSSMCVRFPDINNDGYPDIRVIGSGAGNIVEYIYLPQNDGRRFWHLLKSSGLARSYPPDGQRAFP